MLFEQFACRVRLARLVEKCSESRCVDMALDCTRDDAKSRQVVSGRLPNLNYSCFSKLTVFRSRIQRVDYLWKSARLNRERILISGTFHGVNGTEGWGSGT